jgi:hypothetical protein
MLHFSTNYKEERTHKSDQDITIFGLNIVYWAGDPALKTS